jgi:hypothetical protein
MSKKTNSADNFRAKRSKKDDVLAFQEAGKVRSEAGEALANIEVGDFVSELATAIRYRMRVGYSDGDWIAEPERLYTDGMVFGREESVASGVRLQITVTLDTSRSMWSGGLMHLAAPTFYALDRVIRKAMEDLPQDSIHYAPFIFHEKAIQIPASFLKLFVKHRKGEDGSFTFTAYPDLPALQEANLAGELDRTKTWKDYALSGRNTLLAPLFKAIKDWEETKGDPQALRLDIVITDGKVEDPKDIEKATRLQEDRGGRVRTVFLNFLERNQWTDVSLPDRCSQFAVTAENLDMSIRSIMQEAISELF